MRKLQIAAAVVVGLSGPAAAIDPGVYHCVTERMVGIQMERNKRHNENVANVPRWAGVITPRTDVFVVKIREVDEDKRRRHCEAVAARVADLYGEGSSGWMTQDVIYCDERAKWEAVLPKGRWGPLELDPKVVSADLNLFTNDGSITFWVDADNYYQLVRLGGVFGSFLEEGHCEPSSNGQ